MNDQMQYIVIEGRKPQDGAKPAQALLILPKWISPTLACAGIVGRVIELTDGNVIEQGALPMGEQEILAELREDMRLDTESQMETDDRHEQELQAEGVTAPVASDLTDEVIDALAESMPGGVLGFMKDWGYRQFAREVQARCTTPPQTPADAAQQRDDAYREGMQAARTAVAKRFTEHGMPEGAGMGEWFKAQMEELERHRNSALPVKLNALLLEFGGMAGGEGYDFLRGELEELAQFRKDRPETLAKLQAAEDNLDAWRDAANVNDKIHKYFGEGGRIERLAVSVDATVSNAEQVIAAYRQDLDSAMGSIDERDAEIEQLRTLLKGIRRIAKKGLR